jgi:DnaK suppressor protein
MNNIDLKKFKKKLINIKKDILYKTNSINKKIVNIDINVGDEIDSANIDNEKEIYFGLAANDKTTLNNINDALDKIEKNIYSYCENCNSDISIKRLEAIPWARYCIKCQKEIENNKNKI